MRRRLSTVLILCSYLVTQGASDWTLQCSTCECKWMGGKKVANCSSAGLYKVPTTLHRDIQVLILDNNTISSLGDNVLQDNLPNLQKIFIRSAGLKVIHENAFNNLKILIEVDLSNNNLTELERKTFSGNGRLKVLSLAHNPIQNIKSYQFPTLPHLKTIDLSFCKIQQIKPDAFGNLGNSIESIKLTGNKIQGLQEEAFLPLTNLKSLELHRNPWRCDCHLKSFREWVVEKGLYNYPTTCQEPERLSGKLWDIVPSQEFACKPKIEVSQGRVYSQPGTNVTLGCFIRGNPIPEAKWVLRGRIVNNNTSPLGSNSQTYLIHQLGGMEQWFNLTVINLQEGDADDYTCVAVNAGGVSEQNVTLTFDQPVILGDKQEPVNKRGGLSTTLIGIIAGCVLTLVSVSLVSYACCVSRTRTQPPFSQGSIHSGCSGIDEEHLINNCGISNKAHYPEKHLNKVQESAFSENRGINSYRTQGGMSSLEVEGYPDLLNISSDFSGRQVGLTDRYEVSFDRSGLSATRPQEGGNTSGRQRSNQQQENRRQNGQCLAFPDQVLDPNSLGRAMRPSCCPPSCNTVPTAAILPPPPSFLAPYPAHLVQTVPLTGAHQAHGFITLPRHIKRQDPLTQERDTKEGPTWQQKSSGSRSGESMDVPLVPPPAQFTTCHTRDISEQSFAPNYWAQSSCQTLPHRSALRNRLN